MLELYYFPTATCGLKARLTLAEKAVDFTHRVLDRDAGDLVRPEYLKLNPNAVVPTLVHDGEVLIESSIIMNYVEDAFDGPALRPAAALDRARLNMWLKMADEYYLPALGSVTYGTSGRKNVLKKSPRELEAYYAAIPDPERRRRRRSVVEDGIASTDATRGIRVLDRMLGDMEDALTSTEFLSGAEYGLADAAVTPFVFRLHELDLDWMWSGARPCVTGWWGRIRARQSYKSVIDAQTNPARAALMREAGGEAREAIVAILRTG